MIIVSALIIDLSSTTVVSKLLIRFEDVHEVYQVMGTYDAIALSMASDMNTFNRCIDRIRRVTGDIIQKRSPDGGSAGINP